MKTFKQYIMEEVVYKGLDLSGLETAANQHLEDKLISNKDYDNLKYFVNKAIDQHTQAFIAEIRPAFDSTSDDWHTIYWSALAHSYNEVISMKKRLADTEKQVGKDNPAVKKFRAMYENLLPLAQKVKELKQHVVKASELKKREKEVKQQDEKQKAEKKFHTTGGSLIDILFKETTPLHDEFIKQTRDWAEKDARRFIEMSHWSYDQWKKWDPNPGRHGLSTKAESVRSQAHVVSRIGALAYVDRQIKMAEEHYQNSIYKLAHRVVDKGLDVKNIKAHSSKLNHNFDTTLTDGVKTVRAFTIIASGEIQKPHYRYLVK